MIYEGDGPVPPIWHPASNRHRRPGRPSSGRRVGGGPQTFLGLMVAGFPNMFTVTGPSPSVLTNMVAAIEQHVDWMARCIADLTTGGCSSREAQREWEAHAHEGAERTLDAKANSWHIGANVPGKPKIFMPYLGGFDPYRQICVNVVAAEGFLQTQTGPNHLTQLCRASQTARRTDGQRPS